MEGLVLVLEMGVPLPRHPLSIAPYKVNSLT